MAILHVTDADFEAEVLQSDKPVLVDFWAPWCGPCRMLAPVLEEIDGEIADIAKIVKVDVDENGETAIKYGIMSIPTMMVFVGGEVEHKLVGLRPKEEIVALLKKG